MKKLFTLCLIASSALFAVSSTAQDSAPQLGQDLRVVELFTSQGCSSCPPSNDLVTTWSEDDSVLALTYSVDYWDYLGWRDSFADPKFTALQRSYSKAIGHGRVYTPQIIINGKLDKPRFTKDQVQSVSLTDERPAISLGQSGQVTIGDFPIDAAAQIRVVSFTPGTQDVSIQRGENGGRTLALTNVVTAISDPQPYTGSALSLDAPQDTAFAVIVQKENYGPIIAAAQFTP